jgi:hypothetical protein
MKNFKAYFHSKAVKSKLSRKKLKALEKEGRNQTIVPGAHLTKQNPNSDPGTSDAPSSSTFAAKG